MDIAPDLIASLRRRVAETPRIEGRVVWCDLHARLAAGHATGCALAAERLAAVVPVGSFDLWQSGTKQAFRGINHSDLADCKSADPTDSNIADPSSAGDRG